jgi:hypothetical protein
VDCSNQTCQSVLEMHKGAKPTDQKEEKNPTHWVIFYRSSYETNTHIGRIPLSFTCFTGWTRTLIFPLALLLSSFYAFVILLPTACHATDASHYYYSRPLFGKDSLVSDFRWKRARSSRESENQIAGPLH